ncbi:hypothetical protein BDQ17DRAFT_794519 [Cyathus striatus]|nr:hypothetical protein BDQ17DRAFT_794519 [Cyathus striatus]
MSSRSSRRSRTPPTHHDSRRGAEEVRDPSPGRRSGSGSPTPRHPEHTGPRSRTPPPTHHDSGRRSGRGSSRSRYPEYTGPRSRSRDYDDRRRGHSPRAPHTTYTPSQTHGSSRSLDASQRPHSPARPSTSRSPPLTSRRSRSPTPRQVGTRDGHSRSPTPTRVPVPGSQAPRGVEQRDEPITVFVPSRQPSRHTARPPTVVTLEPEDTGHHPEHTGGASRAGTPRRPSGDRYTPTPSLYEGPRGVGSEVHHTPEGRTATPVVRTDTGRRTAEEASLLELPHDHVVEERPLPVRPYPEHSIRRSTSPAPYSEHSTRRSPSPISYSEDSIRRSPSPTSTRHRTRPSESILSYGRPESPVAVYHPPRATATPVDLRDAEEQREQLERLGEVNVGCWMSQIRPSRRKT